MRDLCNHSLRPHNTFGIEASCHRFIEYSNVEEAQKVAAILREEPLPLLIIGSGSNLLLTKDFEGVVVHSAIRGITQSVCLDDEVVVECGSGEIWDDVVIWSVARGLGCLVNLSLIPGEVGASVVQNIGAYGSEVGEFVHRIEAVEIATEKVVCFHSNECDYGYRSSRFKKEWRNRYLITHVQYRLPRNARLNIEYGHIRSELERQGIQHPTAAELRHTIIGIRRAKLPDPLEEGNAGSFFMNPIVSREKYQGLSAVYSDMPHYEIDNDHVKIPAGWMIEQCGWKGKSLGRAGVHGKQALVLVNRGGATGEEIVALCEKIRHDVKKRFDVDIYPEVNIV